MQLVTPELGLIVWLILSIVLLILPVLTLIDLLRNRFVNNDKLVWTIVVVFLPLIGSVLYWTIGRKQKIKGSV